MLFVNLRTKAGGDLNPMVTLNTRNIDETDTMRITWIMRVAAGSDIVTPLLSSLYVVTDLLSKSHWSQMQAAMLFMLQQKWGTS